MNYSLSYQRQVVEHVAAIHERNPDGGKAQIESLRQTALVLGWLERRQELLKALERLERQRPDLVDLFRTFPGAEIADVRDMYFNGSGVHDDDGA